jgi:hypothetical protein
LTNEVKKSGKTGKFVSCSCFPGIFSNLEHPPQLMQYGIEKPIKWHIHMEWLSTTYAICASDSDFTLTAVHYLHLSYSNLLGYSISSLYNSLDIFFDEGGRRGGEGIC